MNLLLSDWLFLLSILFLCDILLLCLSAVSLYIVLILAPMAAFILRQPRHSQGATFGAVPYHVGG